MSLQKKGNPKTIWRHSTIRKNKYILDIGDVPFIHVHIVFLQGERRQLRINPSVGLHIFSL